MQHIWIVFAVWLALSPVAHAAPPVDRGAEMAHLAWKPGPSTQPLTDHARVSVPAGVLYLDPAGTRRFLELTGNVPEDGAYTLLSQYHGWFAVFQFDDTGFVKDEDKIDPEALLKTLREQEDASNKERADRKLDTLTIEGWAVPPHYDPASHNLEWGTILKSSDGERNINYSTRVLGRHGVLRAILVTDPDKLSAELPDFRQSLAGVRFNGGERYADYKSGDKVAEYGLAALITGGAAAAVVKTGLLAVILKGAAAFIKPIIAAIVAAFAAFRRAFRRKPADQ